MKPECFWIHTAVLFWQLCVWICQILLKKTTTTLNPSRFISLLFKFFKDMLSRTFSGCLFPGSAFFLRLVGISEQMELITAFLLAHPTGLRGPDLVSFAVQFSLVAQSCPTLCSSMDLSTSGLPVHHQLPEFTQTHVLFVSDAIQPSHPLSVPLSSCP